MYVEMRGGRKREMWDMYDAIEEGLLVEMRLPKTRYLMAWMDGSPLDLGGSRVLPRCMEVLRV